MDMTIHAYGYAQTIFNTLNALAMVRTSSLWPAMITTVSLMVGTYYAWRIAGSRHEGEWRGYLMRVFGMLLLINALLIPKQTMYIKDHVEKHYWKVDNIPLAFALPVGAVEQLGHLITMTFEQAFSLVGGKSSFNYYHYGSVFGARLGKEVMTAKMRDPEFISNMHNFMNRCVILPAMIGYQFTKEELVATNDMWGLVSKKAGTFARTDMTIYGKRQSPAPTCREAVPYFEKQMEEAIGWNVTSLSWKFQAAGDSKVYNQQYKQLNANLKNQIAAVYGVENSKVDNILKHNMMINALNDYRAGKFPAVRAQLQHEAGGLISGDLAERILTGLLAVMKNLLYGSFVFVVPLMLMSGGISKYRMWITFCLSLQLWPALSAMLNMLIDYAYDPARIVSYSGWSTELKKFDSMASIAANLTLVIPFLAVWVTRMGEGGFMHLAGSIMASANGGVAAAASEKSTGTRSWDNENIGNTSRDNENSNKINTSMEYVSGGNGWLQADGSMERITPGGNVVRVGGAGSSGSVGHVKLESSEAIHTNLQQGLSDQKILAESDTRSYANSIAETSSKAANYLTQIAEHTRTSEGFNIDTSTEQSKALNEALENIQSMTDHNEYSYQQNAEAYMNASAGVGMKFLGNGAGVEVGGRVMANNSSNQGINDENRISGATNSSKSYHNIMRALSSDSFAKENGIDQSLSTDVRESFDDSKRLEQQVTARQESIDTYHKALDYTNTHGASISKDMYQDVVDAYKLESGKSTSEAIDDIEKRHPAAMRTFNRLAQGDTQQVLQQISLGKHDLSAEVTQDKLDNFSKEHKQNINTDITTSMQNIAASEGFDTQKIKQKVVSKGDELEKQYDRQYQNTDIQYNAVNDSLEDQQYLKRKKIDNLEEDRIGKGFVAGIVGEAVNTVTMGKAGSNIGKPEKEPLPEFEPIMKYYGSDQMISFMDEVPNKVFRPPEDPINEKEIKELMNQFDDTSGGGSQKIEGDGQSVVSMNRKDKA